MTRKDRVVWVVAGLLLAIALPAHAVVLRYEPEVGSVQRHKVSMAGRMESTVEGVGQTMRVEMTSEMTYSEKALSKTDETTTVETELLGGTTTMDMGGQTQTMKMPTGKIVAEMDRRGRMFELVETNMMGGEAAESIMGSGAETMPNWSQFSAFPENDVKVGDTWSDTISVPTEPGGPSIELTFESELIALTTFQDRKCAKMKTSFSGPIEMVMDEMSATGDEGGEGSLDATLSGDLVWYYDYENSVYVYAEGTIGMEMHMVMAVPNMSNGTMTSKMLMNMKVSLMQ